MCNTKNRLFAPFCMALAILAIVASGSAHEGEVHFEKPKAPLASPSEKEKEVFGQINAEYLKDVKPIFRKSCFDCHSSMTSYPWYARLPGAKQLIERDIREAKKHLDLSNDFPFAGHGSPREDLRAIAKSVGDEEMPPLRYWILHSGSRLDDDEKKTVAKWVETSLNAFSAPMPQNDSKEANSK